MTSRSGQLGAGVAAADSAEVEQAIAEARAANAEIAELQRVQTLTIDAEGLDRVDVEAHRALLASIAVTERDVEISRLFVIINHAPGLGGSSTERYVAHEIDGVPQLAGPLAPTRISRTVEGVQGEHEINGARVDLGTDTVWTLHTSVVGEHASPGAFVEADIHAVGQTGPLHIAHGERRPFFSGLIACDLQIRETSGVVRVETGTPVPLDVRYSLERRL